MVDNIASWPLVSIIVPVFNGEQYLRESLDSIIAQTYQRREVIVMNDASTDTTPSIIRSYGDRVISYQQTQNRGQFQNVNDGIARARGEYIAVYHADDIYDPCIVEHEVEFLQQHSEVGAVFCQDIFIDRLGREYGRLEMLPELRGQHVLNYPLIFNTLLTCKNQFLRGPSSMVRASVYRDVGLYRAEEFAIASDLEMWVRIARKYPLGILDEYLCRYRHSHGNLTQQYYHLRTEPERFFKIMDLYLEQGGRELATPDALAAYEAHRAEDFLMLAINHYIIGRLQPAREMLQGARARRILASRRVQRWRLVLLWISIQALLRLPRIPALATMFYRRWHTTFDQTNSRNPLPFSRAQS